MPVFLDDPSQLSISRLKSDLIAHNVRLPPAKSRKEVYVELYLRHVDQKKAVDFSCDEEDEVEDVADEQEEEEDGEDEETPDVSGLTDDALKAALLLHGFRAGPIVASTRAVYEKKLRKLLQPARGDRLNGTERGAALYSDSEEEEEEEESGAAEEERAEQTPDLSTQMETRRASSVHGELDEGDVQERRSQSSRDLPHVDVEKNSSLYFTPKAPPLTKKLPVDPERDAFKHLLPDLQTTPTGIYATRRRPIKGAAGRPVQYVYPDSPVSPTTLQQREVERCLVPIHIQMLVFVLVAFLVYAIYVCVEDESFGPSLALLNFLYQGSEGGQTAVTRPAGFNQ